MEKVSTILDVFFIITTILGVWQFYRASNKSKKFLLIVFIWMTIQFLLGRTNFYDNETTIPPRFILLIFPAFALTILLFFSVGGRKFIDSLSLKKLTLLHTIRNSFVLSFYCKSNPSNNDI
jgi:CDP-diglyceride synthetase